MKALRIYLPVSFRKAMMAARSAGLSRRNAMSVSGITVSGSVSHLLRTVFVPDHAGFLDGVGIGETGDRSGLASDDSGEARSGLFVVERVTARAALFKGGPAGDVVL